MELRDRWFIGGFFALLRMTAICFLLAGCGGNGTEVVNTPNPNETPPGKKFDGPYYIANAVPLGILKSSRSNRNGRGGRSPFSNRKKRAPTAVIFLMSIWRSDWRCCG